MAEPYDIRLNGVGFHLAKQGGVLLSGAAQERYSNPFVNHLSNDERFVRVPFRMGDGGGCAYYDGSNRYEAAYYADTRSGQMLSGLKQSLCQSISIPTVFRINDSDDLDPVSLSNAGNEGAAERFTCAAGKTAIRAVSLLVHRNTAQSYAGASDFTVSIYADAAGPKPGAAVGSATVSPVAEDDPWLPFPDRWRSGDWFWLDVDFGSDLAVTAGTAYWIGVENDQAPALIWAEAGTTGYTRAYWDGAAWGNGADGGRLCYKLEYGDQIDSHPRCFAEYVGVDLVRRMYAGVGTKVMYYDEATSAWVNSQKFTGNVVQMLRFNSLLYIAQGAGNDMYTLDGTSATGTWAQVTGHQAQALALHDSLLWTADDAAVGGVSATPTWGGTVTCGDPGTPVLAMVSHGGALFAAKPEGIFQITYPDTYPTSGNPAANLVLDFRTELASRPWILDWHSGLYFPGLGGMYEWKSSILRNAWTDKQDVGALEIASADDPYTRPRRWAPIFDAQPGGFSSSCGTTRGLIMTYTDAHTQPSDLWIYDNAGNWHELGPLGGEWTGIGATELANPRVGEYALASFLQDIGGGRGRLWVGFGHNIDLIEWPTWTVNRAQVDDAQYHGGGVVVLPRFSLDVQNTPMYLAAVGVTTRGAAEEDETCLIKYAIDGGAWAELGTIDTSPYQEVDFPANTQGREVQLAAILSTAVGAIRVVQIDLLYQPLPEATHVYQLIISAAGGVQLYDGGMETRSSDEILAALAALVTLPGFTYIDPVGTSHTVRVTGLTKQFLRQRNEAGAVLPVEAYVVLSLLGVE